MDQSDLIITTRLESMHLYFIVKIEDLQHLAPVICGRACVNIGGILPGEYEDGIGKMGMEKEKHLT